MSEETWQDALAEYGDAMLAEGRRAAEHPGACRRRSIVGRRGSEHSPTHCGAQPSSASDSRGSEDERHES
jgi:hypothetical protein